jgi:uncharacterized protein YndB with AHSA1/START domain
MTNTGTVQIATPTDRELVMTRVFLAPRILVFDAMTKPELITRWYGPRGWTMLVCEVDLKVGGAFHFVSRREGGKEIGQRGVYLEVVTPARFVYTEEWEDWNPGETVVTCVLTENGGRTTFTSTMLFPSQEVRDMLIKSGMTNGADEAYDKLAELLSSIAAPLSTH